MTLLKNGYSFHDFCCCMNHDKMGTGNLESNCNEIFQENLVQDNLGEFFLYAQSEPFDF